MRVVVVGLVSTLATFTAAEPRALRPGTAIQITKDPWLTKADKSVDIEALNSHIASVKAKFLRESNKFNRGSGHREPSAANQRRKLGPDKLTSYGKKLWYGSISVGTPPVNFIVDFDTGSSDIFLPGYKCGSTCSGHTIYDPKKSGTSHDLSQNFTLSFQDNSTASCDVYTDTVTVAGLTAHNQPLGAATKYSSAFAEDEFLPDGLMGMAFPSISKFGGSPFFQNLISQGQVAEQVFSFSLASPDAELYLGGANPSLYTGNFTYVPLVSCGISMLGLTMSDGHCPGYWEVKMDGIRVNGNPIVPTCNSVIDTGSTAVLADYLSVRIFYTELGGTDASSTLGQGYYTFPCNSFPNVSLVFGGMTFPISTQTLNLGQKSPGSEDCICGIIGTSGIDFWIIGDVFLQNVYTTFDVGNERVGFARLK